MQKSQKTYVPLWSESAQCAYGDVFVFLICGKEIKRFYVILSIGFAWFADILSKIVSIY